jgi:phage terminase large subunit-like protein
VTTPRKRKPPAKRSRSSSKRRKSPGGFWFDEEAADRAVAFFEQCLTHVKGELAGQPLLLDDWEKDRIIRPLFGWRRADGTRRYRKLWAELPRKQGKSTICAGIALYLLHADKEPGAEVYSAAADREQAAIVFDVAKQMVLQSPPLQARTELYRRSMVHLESASSYKVLSADAFTKHGLNASGIVVDEVHAQKNRELIDVLTTSVGARRQPLEVYITTAGYDRKSICWELHEYALKVARGIIQDDAFLPVIYAADPEDDWTSEATWAKANPGLGKSVKLDYLRAECEKAKQIAAYENTFKRLHLNLWTSQDSRWLQVERVWDPCAKAVPTLEQLKGRRAWVGIDCSTTTDITAVVALVEDPANPDEFDVLPYFFVPEEGIRQRARKDRVEYEVWRDQKLIIATDGNVVDYDAVLYKIRELAEYLKIIEIPIDRWNSSGLQTDLTGDGFTVVQFGQGFASMSAPTKELERLLLRKGIRHGGNPVLRWMADNVAIKQDPAGNIKPDKHKSTERIDGIVALVMAIGRALTASPVPLKKYQAFVLG